MNLIGRPICLSLLAFTLLSAGKLRAQTSDPNEARLGGAIFADPETYKSIPLAPTPAGGQLPARVDFSTLFPTPGNQGSQASCVGWAVAYALKSYQEQQERGWTLNSANTVFSPAYIYNQIKKAGCLGGSLITDALDLLTREGVAPLSDFPYDANNCSYRPSAATRKRAEAFRIATWRRVNYQDLMQVKSHIAAGFPIIIAMSFDREFQSLDGDGNYEGLYSAPIGAHALTVAGYDDARNAFRVINSWGTGWGNGGFGWISYPAFGRTVNEAYVAQDIVVYHPPVETAVRPPSRARSIDLRTPIIQHNMFRYGYYEMDIAATGFLYNYAGSTMQIVTRFFFQNGGAVFAHPQEQRHFSADRTVATGTTRIPVPSDFVNLASYRMSIPYYSFNLTPTNGTTTYYLNLTVDLFVDDVIVASSPAVPFYVRW